MSVKLFIGGLAWATDDNSLRTKFEEYGEVSDAVVIKDRETGRSKGFGFVTYINSLDAENAINKMNNQELDGRTIRVDRASDRPERPPRASYGNREYGNRGYGSREGGSYGGAGREGGSYGQRRPYGDRDGGRRDGPRDYERRERRYED